MWEISDVPSHRTGSAARQGGDEFQHLVAFTRILRALPTHQQLRSVGLEAPDVGNVDDIVIRSDAAPDEFTQVKFAVDLATPMETDYLLSSTSKGTSLLQKFHSSWLLLGGASEHPLLQLITNRVPHPSDPVLVHVEGRTSSLAAAMRYAETGTKLATKRVEWAAHLGVEETELLELLGDLKLRLGCQEANEFERASDLMMQAGLQYDPASVNVGVDMVRGWVLESRRTLTADEVRTEIDGLSLAVAEPAATLLVQAIDLDPAPQDADVVLDWLDRYEGDSPKVRRHLVGSATYEGLHNELRAAANQLLGSGERRVVVRGAMRLATWFAAGEALSEVQGVALTCGRFGQFWSSTDEGASAAVTNDVVDRPAQGDDLVVVLAFAADLTDDVISFVRSSGVPASTIVRIGAPDGRRVESGAEAVAYTREIKGVVRKALRDASARRVHLFMASPAGLALLLGHVWNRVAPTVVWEDLGLDGYAEAFHVDA